jgi:hypothetical protein
MAAWNDTLTAVVPNQIGFSEKPPNIVLETKMDAGPSKKRRRYTAGIRPIRFSVDLTQAQVALLDTFFITTTLSGTLPFDWVHPRTSATHAVRFKGEPEYFPREHEASANIEIEVLA